MSRGGARPNAGRKSKREEAKANTIFLNALKLIYSKEEEEEAKVAFVQDLAKSTRGQIFIAEHLFGKAPDTVNSNVNLLENFSLKNLYGKDKEA